VWSGAFTGDLKNEKATRRLGTHRPSRKVTPSVAATKYLNWAKWSAVSWTRSTP